MQTIHTVVYLLPGSFVSEEYRVNVGYWDVEKARQDCRDNVFAFYFTTAIVPDPIPDGSGGYFKVIPKIEKTSGRYYPKGRVYELADIEYFFGKYDTLYLNMKSNGWDRVVKTRAGNFQPFRKNDQIIP